MALKYISELTMTNNIDDTDLLVIDDGSKNYAIRWSTLKAALATVSGFTVNNTNGTITITLATGASLTVTPHDPTKQNVLTFDSAPTENSNNPVKSGGVFAALGLKLDAEDYAQYTGATDQNAGTAGYVPAPVAGGERYLSSSGVWQAPDSAPTENSNKLITSDAVYAALLDLAEQLSDEYDATATYDVGDYCIHENKLYKCTTAIATAEAWNSAHWTATTVGAELGAKVNTSDIVNNLVSGSTNPVSSGGVYDWTVPVRLTIIPASSSDTLKRAWAYKIGKLVIINILMARSTQISAGTGLFRLAGPDGSDIKYPADNTSTTYHNLPMLVWYGGVVNVSGSAADAQGHEWITCGATISANTDIVISGCFVCA